MNEIQEAAKYLKSYYAGDIVGDDVKIVSKHRMTAIFDWLDLQDKTLLDENFAKQIAVPDEAHVGMYNVGKAHDGAELLLLFLNGQTTLWCGGYRKKSPTVGDFHLACKLFDVKSSSEETL